MNELWIALICLLVYSKTIYNFFVIDDLSVLLKTQGNKTPRPGLRRMLLDQLVGNNYWPKRFPRKFENPHLTIKRVIALFIKNIQAIGYSAHLLRIIIHTLVSVLICWNFGFIPALLFSILPFNNEVSLWLSGKGYGLTAIGFLLCWKLPLLFPVALLLIPPGYISISIICLPLLFLLKPGYEWLAILIIVTLYKKVHQAFDPKSPKVAAHCNHVEAWKITPRKLIIAFKFYGYYFIQVLLAFKCATFHKYNSQYLASREGTEKAYKQIDAYLIIGIALFIFTIWTRNFGLLWFTIAIAPFLNFISVGNQLVAMRYSYIANIGLMVAVAQIPYAWIFLSGYYFSKLFYVMINYKNDTWNNFFQMMEEPDYFHSWLLQGGMHFARGHFGQALQDYAEASRCDPHNFKVWFNISSAYVAYYNIPKAIAALEKAKEFDLYGQEQTKENVVTEREVLIGRMIQAQEKGEPLQLRICDIPLII